MTEREEMLVFIISYIVAQPIFLFGYMLLKAAFDGKKE